MHLIERSERGAREGSECIHLPVHTVSRTTALVGSQIWIALLVALIVHLVFFRQQILNHFSFLLGDRYDGVIQVALLEHWFNTLRGLAEWSRPNYFFPYEKTLGYNEGLFLYGLIYSGFRFFSFDPLLSSELVNVVVKAIGFAGFFVASRQMLRLSFWWSLLGASIFTLSNSSFVLGVHAQLLSVSLVPVEAVLIYEAYKALIASRRLPFLVWGSLTVIVFSLWMLTCLYMAWFFAFFVSITVVIQLTIGGMPIISEMKRALSENKAAILVISLLAIVSLIPFVSVYLTGQHGGKQRPWSDILPYIPSVFDSINVGENNLLFGRLISFMQHWCSICDIGERGRDTGFAPAIFIVAAFGIKRIVGHRLSFLPEGRILIGGIAMACIATWLLSIRFGEFSGWHLIYTVWPGAKGLRVVSRFHLFLTAPIIGMAIWYLSQRVSTWPKPFVLMLCGLLVVEELNVGPGTVGLDRFKELERTIAVQKPPAECRAFYTTATVDQDPSFVIGAIYPHNVDAMLVAEYVNLPTINGFASFNPPDWDFDYPDKSDYILRIKRYAKLHGITGLCHLDLITMRWIASS